MKGAGHETKSLYALFQQLGHTSRNLSETSLPVEGMKALMALCTLMNARSNTFKSLQLKFNNSKRHVHAMYE